MAELSRDQVDEIVARVTAAVREEELAHNDAVVAQGELRIPMRSVRDVPEGVLWAPWVVWLPPDLAGLEVRDRPDAAE